MSLSRSILAGGLAPLVTQTAARPVARPVAERQQADGSTWGGIVAELGIGRADLGAEAPHPWRSSEADEHGWAAIVAELGLGRVARPAAHQPPVADTSAETTPWAEIIAEAGLASGATHPGAAFGADPEWSQLAAEAAAERSSNPA